ncbi:DHH family phosphoesterase [Hutsoniella sourekii]
MKTLEQIKYFFKAFQSFAISWQIYTLLLIYCVISLIALFLHWQIGLMLILFLLLLVVFFALNINNIMQNINALANDLSKNANKSYNQALYKAPIAIVMYDNNLRIKWVNPAMQASFKGRELLGSKIENLGSEFIKIIEEDSEDKWDLITIGDRTFKYQHETDNQSIYLVDVSRETEIVEQQNNNLLVFGYIFLDDYNEVVETMDDEQATNFDASLFASINSWTKEFNIYSKRIDDEKIIIIMNLATLKELEKNKFKFFDELYQKNYKNNIPISISLGIAYPSRKNYGINDLADQAQLNLDLALGRGGNQVVVRAADERARFYGGGSNPSQKRSNVKSRLIYQALKTSIRQADFVWISGHKQPDLDSIASAIGVQKIVHQLGKDSKIIIDEQGLNSDVQALLRMADEPSIKVNFIDPASAKDQLGSKNLLILVDHHRPSLSEASDLLGQVDVVVIDHHRRGEEFVARSILTYIEPYASSTSELITEFFMNRRNLSGGLNAFEATALLAGIIVDTNNFGSRTGSRTFDAASYLKSRGASTNQIQHILKEDLDSVIKRNKLIETIRLIGNGYSVALGPDDQIYDNIIASQAADMMLDIKDIEASFVIYRRDKDVVGISARSLGDINVQRIMEQLDGGGHLSNAATQLKDLTIKEAYNKLLLVIQEMEEE